MPFRQTRCKTRYKLLFGRTNSSAGIIHENIFSTMFGPFKSWRSPQETPVTQSTTSESSSESTASTESCDTDAPLQPNVPQYSPWLKVCRAIRKELKRYGKPGLKRDLASWTGVMIIGTSFMMYVLSSRFISPPRSSSFWYTVIPLAMALP